MHCRGCQRALWKVASRRCPGCDRPFKPSDFRFRPETVRFCCPHCSQGYLGRGADGFPDPKRFACVFCDRVIEADEMVLEVAQGVEEHQTQPDMLPWIEAHRPWPMRWGLTVWFAFSAPRRLMQLTPADLPPRVAVVFMAVTQGLLAVGCVVLAGGLGVVLSLPGGVRAFGVLTGPGLLRLVLTLVGTALFALGWIAVAHALARRAGKEVSRTRTVHAVCFTSTPQALWLLPAIGPFVGWVGTLLWVRSVAGALAEVHSLSPRAARRAAGGWPVVCLLLTVGVWGASAVGLFGGRSGAAAEWFSSDTQSVSRFADSLLGEAGSSARVFGYAGELMVDGRVPPAGFLAPGSRTTLAGVELAGVTLEQFAQLAPARRLAVVQQAADRLVPGAPAHRLGDFVFILDGLMLEDAPPGLWVVVEAWDPSHNAPGGMVHVLHVDGSVRSMQSDGVPEALEAQNRLRREIGLPVLPDPRSLRHDLATTGEG